MVDVYGSDIKSDFSFSDGDLKIVSNIDNLGQAIVNRLNTDLGFYDWCYTNYGGNLSNVYGMVNDNALEYLRVEVESVLRQDPRIKEVSCTCSKDDPQSVYVELDILPIGSDEVVSLNLVVQDDLIVKLDTEGIDTDKIAMGDRL